MNDRTRALSGPIPAIAAALVAIAGCAGEVEPARSGGLGLWDASAEPRTGVFRIDGEEHELPYLRVGDEMIFEHDIVLDPADQVIREPGRATEALFAVGSDGRLWPDAVVPYVIADSITTPGRVRNAMAVWAATGIRFVPRNRETSYVVFRERDQRVCTASVGYARDSVRYVNLRDTSRHPACPLGVVVHEIGHTLGLWHEQTRPDRDEHVRVLWENIPAAYESQFEIGPGRRLGPYDITSTMHYLSTMLNNDRGPSIVRRDGSRIGHDWSTLSPGDIAGIRTLYFEGTPAAGTEEPPATEPDDGPPDTGEDGVDSVVPDVVVDGLGTPVVQAAPLAPDLALAKPAGVPTTRTPAAGCSVGTTGTPVPPLALAIAATLLLLAARRRSPHR